MTDPVQQQLEAFNERNLEDFLEAYASDTLIEDGSGEEIMRGKDQVRAFYSEVFNNSPDLHCDVVNRISVGDWVIDEEKIEGLHAEGFPEEAHAAVAYQVTDGEITLVRMCV